MEHHLSRLHFIHMLTAATILHFGLLIVWSLMPHKQVPLIPVRALNIKLGGSDNGQPALPFAAPQVTMDNSDLSTMAPASGGARGRDMDAVLNSLENSINKSQDTSKLEDVIKQKFRPKDSKPGQTLANTPPVKYVRENPANAVPNAQGDLLGDTDEGSEAITRYEQRISLWIRNHKRYPREAEMQGSEGTATIRIWINRSGTILSYEILRSTGSSLLDRAIGDMIGRSNPVPPVPHSYPGGERLAFQMDVDFFLKSR